MKTTIFCTSLIAGIFLSLNAGAAPGASAGGGVHAASPAVRATPSASAVTTTTATGAGNTATGTENGTGIVAGGVPGGIPGDSQRNLPPGQQTPQPDATATTTANQVAPSNQIGMATNQMPASNSPINANANNINGNTLGQAVTASDRNLLATLNQSVSTQLEATSQGAIPVRFLINNGAVTIVGSVPNTDQSQRILARVQQTPGVVSVFNDLRVGAAPNAVPAQSSFVGTTTDHAFSPADQSLLTAVQQQAGAQFGINGASTAQLPVHFSIQNGVVGVMGAVQSLQEKQALVTALQRIPGVTRVVDNVAISGGAAGGVNGPTGLQPNQFQNNNNLPATSRDANQPNSMFLNPSNTSGF
jgi:osmotically-inducible protein OsmY